MDWVISPRYGDTVFGGDSNRSTLSVYFRHGPSVPDHRQWQLISSDDEPKGGGRGFSLTRADNGYGVSFPHWFLAACSLGFAALFAFKKTWRFRLRSILIATTLLVIALGLGVYFL
jgi:hypothetical protein